LLMAASKKAECSLERVIEGVWSRKHVYTYYSEIR
jgi:hypothetical protein